MTLNVSHIFKESIKKILKYNVSNVSKLDAMTINICRYTLRIAMPQITRVIIKGVEFSRS